MHHKHWFHLSLHILPFASFHTDFTSISSDMTCLQSKAFAETQCHQLITSFALRKVACTNRICNTSVVQHKHATSESAHEENHAAFVLADHQRQSSWHCLTGGHFPPKKPPEICWSISRISCWVSYNLHINPSQDPPNLPRPKTNRTKKHIHHLKMYMMYVLLKNGYFPGFSPGCIHQLTREFVG